MKESGVAMPNFGNVGRELAKEINEEPEEEEETEDESKFLKFYPVMSESLFYDQDAIDFYWRTRRRS